MSEDNDAGGLDDFLEAMGLDTKPLSPEHALMLKLEGGKIHEYRYWIRHEMFTYHDLVKNKLYICKINLSRDNYAEYLDRVTQQDWARVRTKYYLRMRYLPWFNSDVSGIGVADIDKMTQTMMEHEDIKPIIDAKEDDLPRNGY